MEKKVKRDRPTENQKGFIQGYTLAVVTMISFEGGVSTPIRELWEALGTKIAELPKYKVDPMDYDTMIKYRKELERPKI